MKFAVLPIVILVLIGALGRTGFAQNDDVHHEHSAHDMQNMKADVAVRKIDGAATAQLGTLDISNGFTRAMPPAAKTGGGFLSIRNNGAEDDRLMRMRSPAAGRMELHNMSMQDNVMVMREITEGLVVPAGESVHLAPGGMHMMFLQVETPFIEGTKVDVTLTFEKAGDVTMALSVAGIGATGMAY